ncbi:hypothetical protein EP7_000369 [Isosphaeraceae bacterium EP7]
MRIIQDIAEFLAGVVIALVTLLILAVGALFAFGSMGKYIRNKSM